MKSSVCTVLIIFISISTLFSNPSELPEVINFEDIKFFYFHYRDDPAHSWSWKLANSAFELGYIGFNDSPEIGAFIQQLKKEYHLDAAIETGTSFGATTRFFSLHFDQVHTIEAVESVYLRAKENLKDCKNVECHFGSSEKVLSNLLPSLQNNRLLFYLDSHIYFQEADAAGFHYWPILEELEAISKTHQNQCIIVIDDFSVPGTNIHGCLDRNGINELSHQLIRKKLNQIFSGYSFHYLIPRTVSRSAKLVIIPKQWQKPTYKGRIDILSGFNIFDFPIQLQNVKDEGYEINMLHQYPYPYEDDFTPYDPDLKKIIVFGWTLDPSILAKLPKEKLLFFIMEPFLVSPAYYDQYPYIYTCCDDLVDGIKFFKLFYPYLMPMRKNLPPFEKKKFCVMISGSDNEYPERPNELYSERMKMVEFFEGKPEGEFDLYGRFWVKRHYRDFRGAIPGDHSGKEKLDVLTNYRFGICFENTKDLNGYITEKIFAFFAAGCVPVYWGAANIETYIPKNCFIDYRDFNNREELYQFLKRMPKDLYEHYLDNIRAFLNSNQALLFSPQHFEQTFLEAILR